MTLGLAKRPIIDGFIASNTNDRLVEVGLDKSHVIGNCRR